MTAVYLFKRDLRVSDNRGLHKASEDFEEVVPIFIIDPDIIQDLKAEGERAYFLIKSLELLSSEIDLYCLYAKTEDALKQVFRVAKPKALYTSTSYTWSGKKRNEDIKRVCLEYGIEYKEVFDNFLVPPLLISPKKTFTHFFKEWIQKLDTDMIKKKPRMKIPKLQLPKLKDVVNSLPAREYEHFRPQDFRKRLENFTFEEYEKTRNYLHIDGTSRLSPYIRFGIVSIRDVLMRTKGKSEQFVKELGWREFWYNIAYHFPWTKDIELQEKRRNIRWENREEYIRRFIEGRTGYPIVDAGIRQLISEKWIHNRMRMIIASFLTKVLLVDWRIGERFFKEHLLDYDEVVNVGNWQWSSSVGADPRPMRFFNPILQAKKYDPDCQYIKKYLPELSKVPPYMLHDPLKYELPYEKPLVNYHERIQMVKRAYEAADNN